MKIMTLMIILGTLAWTAWSAGRFLWSIYLEHQNAAVEAHIAWSDAVWGLGPTFAVILALVLALRLAIREMLR